MGYKIKKRYVGRGVIRKLPLEYQEVEYIQSTGTQRIDTGYSPSGTYSGVEVKFNYLSLAVSGGNTPFVYGNVGSTYAFLTRDVSTGKFNAGVGASTIMTSDIPVSTGTDYVAKIIGTGGTQTLDVNGTTYSSTYTGTISTGPIQLFCRQKGSSYEYYATNMRMYYFKIYSAADTLVRDLVPCYRKSDNVIGLYDLVNDQFYTNAGSGAFSKGNDVKYYDQIRPAALPITEYVMLSSGGSTNKWSELSLSGTASVRNQTTYWQGYVNTTDTFGTHYKVFDKKIVGFEVQMYPTGGGSYEWIKFFIGPTASFNSGANRYILNGYEFYQSANRYEGGSTGVVSCGERVSGTGTSIFWDYKNSANTLGTWTGKLENGVWKLRVDLANGQSWSATHTPSSVNQDLYVIGVQSGRWYTGEAGRFLVVKVYLEG